MALSVEQAALFMRAASERLALEDDKVVMEMVTVFASAATHAARVLGGASEYLVSKGYEPGHANAIAFAAVKAAGEGYASQATDNPEGVPDREVNEPYLLEMVETFLQYNSLCKAENEAAVKKTTDNIIHGLFGRVPDDGKAS